MKEKRIQSTQQERILTSAKTCFIQRGLARTTMRDIAEVAGMSLGNIYRYFKNKDALIEAFVASDQQEQDDAFASLSSAKHFKELLIDLCANLIVTLADRGKITLYIDILGEALRDQKTNTSHGQASREASLQQALEAASAKGHIALKLPAEVASTAILAFIENAAIKCISQQSYSTQLANKQVQQLIDTLIHE